jgi:hypothetical protein
VRRDSIRADSTRRANSDSARQARAADSARRAIAAPPRPAPIDTARRDTTPPVTPPPTQR